MTWPGGVTPTEAAALLTAVAAVIAAWRGNGRSRKAAEQAAREVSPGSGTLYELVQVLKADLLELRRDLGGLRADMRQWVSDNSVAHQTLGGRVDALERKADAPIPPHATLDLPRHDGRPSRPRRLRRPRG